MDTTLIAALITAVASLIGVILTIIFTNRRKDKGSQAPSSYSQTGRADGQVIQASGTATQNVTISTSSAGTPENHSREQLRATLDEMLDALNVALQENQRVLTPLFQDNPDVTAVRNDLIALYNIQTQRGNFSKWQHELMSFPANSDNEKAEIRELLLEIDQFRRRFYEYDSGYPARPISDWDWNAVKEMFDYNKIDLITILRDPSRNDQQMQEIADLYLRDLRTQYERVGSHIGKLKSAL